LTKPEHERDAADNLIAICYPVERADSPSGILELRKVSARPFKLQ
jgi:hypothetical protein